MHDHGSKRTSATSLARYGAAWGMLACLSGCASMAPMSSEDMDAAVHDPWESANRKVFAFNDSVDRSVVKPVAQAYVRAVPQPVRDSVGHFFGNLQDAWSAVNWSLQAQFDRGIEQGARFVVNSTLGLGGLFDVGRHMGLGKSSQDFGQTLGVWGFGAGPYVVLPLLGPSTVRDSVALPVNTLVTGNNFVDGRTARAALTALDLTNQRATFLAAERTIDSIALDRYTFIRDAYLQRRNARRPLTNDKDFEAATPAAGAFASSSPGP
jgi:phospholipid-binding lipoprotein MlaA